MEMLIAVFDMLRRLVKAVGPYVMIEILLPGGSLIALGLFLYRRGWLGWLFSRSRRPQTPAAAESASCLSGC